MRHNPSALALSLLLVALSASCAILRPPLPTQYEPPQVHVAPAPDLPAYDFKLGPDMTACLDFAGLVAYQEEQAKLYARLAYFKTLLIQYGAVFDPAPPAQAVP